MNTTIVIEAALENAGMRVDQFLAQHLMQSRSQVQFLLSEGRVKLVSPILSSSYRVKVGEIFTVDLPEPKPSELVAQDLELDIIYDDSDIIVINKPAGMVVHPSAGHEDNTLVNALLYRYPDMVITHEQRPGIVHRLDKDTSGVMVCARNTAALEHLMNSFRDRQVEKIYRAFCWGDFEYEIFELKTGHRRHTSDRKKYTTKVKVPENEVSGNGNRFAHSHFEVLQTKHKVSELKVTLFTGRTHQIRAHLADIGRPILMDQTYGGVKNVGNMADSALKNAVSRLDRHALHSETMAFVHPKSGESLRFTAPLPEDLGLLHEALQE